MSKKFRLKNGLTVLLTENHKAPVVSIQMWVRTGSADEKLGEEGISHFIEHLVFKGTKKFGVGQIASLVEGSGGELNAYTSFDQTVFYVTLSKHFTDVGLEVISEMMGFPTFDPEEVDREREVVVEEIKRGKDSLDRRASELLFSTSYTKHPYGKPVIGYEKNVRKWSAKKIVSYFHERYSPRNMFLVVSGDFNQAEMKKKIQNYFSDFQDYKVRKIKRIKEPKQNQARLSVETSEFNQSLAYLAWKIPPIDHKDIPALDVLALVLGQGDSSRLVQKLRIHSATVNSIGASTFSPIDEGIFTISFGYNKDRLQQALTGIQDELLNILQTPVGKEEIQKAVLNLSSEEYYSLETVDGLSRKMGALEFYFQDLKYQEFYLKELRRVTARDLQRVAAKYLTMETLSLAVVTNDKKAAVEKLAKRWLQESKAQLKKIKPLPLKPVSIRHQTVKPLAKGQSREKTHKVILPNGVSVLLRRSDETQLVSVKSAFLGGVRAEPSGCEGLSELMGRTWTCGTKTKTEEQIYHETESMAAGLQALAGRNSIGLGMDFIQAFEKKAAELFLDLLGQPLFPEAALEREKLVQLEQIKSRNDNPSQSCMRFFAKTIFAEHPYARDLVGTEESLKLLSASAAREQWMKIAQLKNLTVILCGRFDEDFWLGKLETQLSGLPQGARFEKTFLTPKNHSQIVFEKSKKEQSHVVVGFQGLTLLDRDRYTLEIIQSILAGQGGRLFVELRDKNSLAYSVAPIRMEGIDAGYFGAYIGCSPEKVALATRMMREQFDLLCQQQVLDEELERAKRYVIGRHDIDLQRTSAVAAAILYDDIYGIHFDETFTCSDNYQSVTPGDILRVSQKIFKQPAVTALVGPVNPLESA